MKRKFVYLALALLVPIGIFLVLRNFGKNRFDLPVYHAESLPALAVECGYTYEVPYVVSDSTSAQLGITLPAVFMIDFTATAEARAQQVQVSRLRSLHPDGIRWVPWKGEAGVFVCIFLVPDGQNAALVDRDRRIRGYYSTLMREDMDRLDLELKILKEEY